MDSTEADMIERARRGDRQALDSLFRRHADTILAHARHTIDPRRQTHLSPEDVLQTTCIDAMRHIAAFSPRSDGAFAQWLLPARPQLTSEPVASRRTCERNERNSLAGQRRSEV